jgi:two-component system LytT family response regulator
MLERLESILRQQSAFPDRLASRVGERVHLIELIHVTHFFAKDKLTFAAADGRADAIDATIAELERKLDPGRFVRIHRAIILNLAWVQDIDTWFGGRMLVRLKDAKHTELTVARDRVRALRDQLSF